MDERKPFDLDAYVQSATTGPCFICELVAGNPAYAHHIIAEDDETIIFLSKYPTLRGYSLVCPKAHREDFANDLSLDEYLALQAKVHRLARALKQMFDAERIYVLSLGSQQANRHLHFHVVPLPNRPFPAPQPYAETGPIFLHAEECLAYDAAQGLPPRHRGGRNAQILRGYGDDDRIVYGTGIVVEPAAIEATAAELLGRDDVAYLHMRSATNNCFTLRIDR